MLSRRILNKYLLKELIPPFLIGVCVFVFILMTTQIIKINQLIIVHGVSIREASLIVFYLILTFLSISIPLALLFSSLLVLGRLSSDREIIAMRACGISQFQMLPPFLFAASILMVLVLFLTFFVEPFGFQQFRVITKNIGADISAAMIKPRSFHEKFFDMMIYVDNVNTESNSFNGIFIHDKRISEHPLSIFAKTGSLFQDKDGQALTLRLEEGSIHREQTQEDEGYQKINFGIYDINIDLETLLSLPAKKPRMLTYEELRTQLATLYPNSAEWRKHAVELHRKLGLGVGCLVFVIFGVAIGARTRGTVRSSAFLITILFMLVYWILYVKMSAWASDRVIPVWLAMWLPNILVTLVGGAVLLKNNRT